MKEIRKLTLVAVVSAAIGALAAEVVQAKITATGQTTAFAAVSGTAQNKSYADWAGAMNQSFGSRILATGGNLGAGALRRPQPNASVFDGLDKMQDWRGGSGT